MLTFDDPSKRTLVAHTDVPTAEIVVIDNNEFIVARGVGTLSADLAPGIYQLRYRIGEKVVDRIIALRPGDGEMRVEPPQLPIETPAPLPSTSPDTSEWSSLVEARSRLVDVSYGTGSRLFVFINPTATSDFLDRLTLCTSDGSEITSLSAARSTDGCFALNLDVDPGSYLIRVKDGSEPAIEQTVVACAGWQTQLFFQPFIAGELSAVDLSQCAVLMRSIENGLAITSDDFRWTEAARQSLANRRGSAAPIDRLKMRMGEAEEIRRSTVDDTTQQRMLRAKFGNPMLGIYGAHLLLLNEIRTVPCLPRLHKICGR